ncbi:MAG: ATP-binding cassette domain-containing protein, partial [Spirochaetales bacterium]|nr:ATP-binding cassette domain-containing protein [Spirochaetales bacterium]
FKAAPGTTTAIIGSTGSGKSTILNLIPRFHDISRGKLLIDGVDVRDYALKDLRQMVGYVPQQGLLFSGTIASNIAFGNAQIPQDEIEWAAEVSQATHFIGERDGEYESHIAQGGTNVSGGQRQRLSIARALARRPQILLFDDSFSALDYKTEQLVRHRLMEELSDATVIIVAQRISTILHADNIIVLDEGRIVGQGRHKELMEGCRVYQEIASSQLSQQELTSHG